MNISILVILFFATSVSAMIDRGDLPRLPHDVMTDKISAVHRYHNLSDYECGIKMAPLEREYERSVIFWRFHMNVKSIISVRNRRSLQKAAKSFPYRQHQRPIFFPKQ